MKSENTTKPYRQHVIERLKTFEDAGAYLATSLSENADYPAAIGLAIEDIIVAFNLPLKVSVVAAAAATAAPVEQSEPPALDCLVHGHQWKQEGTKHFCTYCGTGVDVGPTVSPARAAAEEWFTTSATHYEDDQDAINALTAIIERHYEGAR